MSELSQPQKLALLLKTVGLTIDDLGEDKDRILYTFFSEQNDMTVVPRLGREDLVLDWIVIFRDSDSLDTPEKSKQFHLDLLDAMKDNIIDPEPQIPNVGSLTASQYMTLLESKGFHFPTRKSILESRSLSYDLDRSEHHISQSMTFSDYVMNYMCDQSLGTVQDNEYVPEAKRTSYNSNIINDGTKNLDMSENHE